MWLYKATWPVGLIFVIIAAVIHTSSPALIKKGNRRAQVEQMRSKGVAGDAKRNDMKRHDVWRGRYSSKSQPTASVNVFNSTSDSLVSLVEPRINAEIVFPQLDFNNTSYENGSFWSSNLEKRYLRYHRQHRPLQVFVIPHSHQDPGWLQTFESYYLRHTKSTLDNIVSKMTQYRKMTFVWSEISFLAKWWESATSNQKDKFKSLIEEGRLEIGTGGWVMADEATVNLYSLVDQLIEGHQWMKGNLNVTPTTSWSIDPFGHSGVLPMILKKTGVDSMVIQRVHYGWKKWFANNQAGDFKWIQRWDTTGEGSVLCHNNPYDLYSIKHSCGPYKDICLKFDFRDIRGERGESCGKAEPIDDSNVQEKAELLLEQYQRTASLYPHNIAMITLGDDFRFDFSIEWDQQYQNYMKLFDYINSNPSLYNAQVQFGTISDYFKAVKESGKDLPTFAGDFFPYGDVYAEGVASYWTGYFTTRPYYKKLYRETESDVRSAEILYTIAVNTARQQKRIADVKALEEMYTKLTTARRWLALFAHHDGTTGTSKIGTMLDYRTKLAEASRYAQFIQSASTSFILFSRPSNGNKTKSVSNPAVGTLTPSVRFDSKEPLKFTGRKSKAHNVVLFNSLTWSRHEYVKMLVRSPYVKVVGPNETDVVAQINPVTAVQNGVVHISNDWYELVFIAHVPPLSLSTYVVSRTKANSSRVVRKSELFCLDNSCIDPAKLFEIKYIGKGDIYLENDRMRVDLNQYSGLISGISIFDTIRNAKVQQSFGAYPSYHGGAYIFRPNMRREQDVPFQRPRALLITRGDVTSEISVHQSPIAITTRIFNHGDDALKEAVFIKNTVDIDQNDLEVYMRFQTDLHSTSLNSKLYKAPTFYTDQNGFTMAKRMSVKSIGLEGNVYPVNTMAFVQDEEKELRFSVLVDHAQGFSSFEKGRLEGLIERRLPFDDGRGMQEGVTDNRPTTSNYILLLEQVKINDEAADYRNSLPTLTAYRMSQQLNYPLSMFVYSQSAATKVQPGFKTVTLLSKELPWDLNLLNLRTVSTFDDKGSEVPSKSALFVIQKSTFNPSNDPRPFCHDCAKDFEVSFNALKESSRESRTLTGQPRTLLLRKNETLSSKVFDLVTVQISFV